jgi:predicted Zn-dependent peptidase
MQEKKFDKVRDKEALDTAIDAAQKSVNSGTESPKTLSSLLYNLAVKIFKRFLETDEEHLDQLDEAIELQSRALQALDGQDVHP